MMEKRHEQVRWRSRETTEQMEMENGKKKKKEEEGGNKIIKGK